MPSEKAFVDMLSFSLEATHVSRARAWGEIVSRNSAASNEQILEQTTLPDLGRYFQYLGEKIVHLNIPTG